jgi:hypothetical protein
VAIARRTRVPASLTLPPSPHPSYPSAPLGPADLVVKPLKGLAPPHIAALQEVALAAASDEDYAGTAAIFGVCTAVQEWLAEHNETGLDDMSAHAVMMRRETENAAGDEDAEEATDGAKPKGAAAAIAAKGDGADRVLTPFVDGDTPVTEATFAAWKEGFDAEMAAAAAADPSAAVFGCKCVKGDAVSAAAAAAAAAAAGAAG